MAQFAYNNGKAMVARYGVDSLDFGLLLLKAGYTPDKDHQFVSDLTPASNEIVTAGYARMTGISATVAVNNTLDRAEITWPYQLLTGLGVPTYPVVTAGVMYCNTPGTDATRWLLLYLDSIAFTTNGSDVLFSFDATGLLRI